jgi:Conjugative transposon protein TcpC
MIGRLARLRSTSPRRPGTVGGLLARFGRAVLWLVVGVVLIRGLASTFVTDRRAGVIPARVAAAATWPGDAARSFAVEFATVYLTHSPTDDAGADAARLEAFASSELVAEMAPRFEGRESHEAVRSATVAGVARIDRDHALVTVAATVDGPTSRRLVTVPIARDDRGGLVVDDLPSFAAAPPRAATDTPEPEPLLGPERAAIVAVLTPFMRAYLAGDGSALTYLVPPGTRIAAAAGRWELLNLTSVSAAGPASDAGRVVLVALQARDVRSRAMYALRYRVRLVRRDRWYVAALNGPGTGIR